MTKILRGGGANLEAGDITPTLLSQKNNRNLYGNGLHTLASNNPLFNFISPQVEYSSDVSVPPSSNAIDLTQRSPERQKSRLATIANTCSDSSDPQTSTYVWWQGSSSSEGWQYRRLNLSTDDVQLVTGQSDDDGFLACDISTSGNLVSIVTVDNTTTSGSVRVFDGSGAQLAIATLSITDEGNYIAECATSNNGQHAIFIIRDNITRVVSIYRYTATAPNTITLVNTFTDTSNFYISSNLSNGSSYISDDGTVVTYCSSSAVLHSTSSASDFNASPPRFLETGNTGMLRFVDKTSGRVFTITSTTLEGSQWALSDFDGSNSTSLTLPTFNNLTYSTPNVATGQEVSVNSVEIYKSIGRFVLGSVISDPFNNVDGDTLYNNSFFIYDTTLQRIVHMSNSTTSTVTSRGGGPIYVPMRDKANTALETHNAICELGGIIRLGAGTEGTTSTDNFNRAGSSIALALRYGAEHRLGKLVGEEV